MTTEDGPRMSNSLPDTPTSGADTQSVAEEASDRAFVTAHDGGQNAYGKYFLLKVPNYNGAPGDGALGSYLRLGAIEDLDRAGNPHAPLHTGEDLASKITSFVDDTRLRDGCPDFIPVAERQVETAKLHTKGGIRLHTDGNMVETVRGDYVCVVGGHYRMVVQARQPTDVDQSIVDISGGHVYENGITFKGDTIIEYTTKLFGGTWMVFEDTVKSHVSTTYHGRVYDYYAGDVVESVTGSETPTPDLPNPVVNERTWAESLASYTGSAAWPVPSITDDTWASIIASTTHADGITDTTTVTGAITESTSAGSISSTTNVSGTISDTTTASTISSTTTAAAITDTTTAGVIASTTTGNVVDTTIGQSMSTIIGSETEIIIGNSMEVNLGAQESFTLGMTLDLTVGLMIDIALAGSISVDIGPKLVFAITRTWGITAENGEVTVNGTKLTETEVEADGLYNKLSTLSNFI
ncbi:Putative cell-wall-anchored protein SasA (LPXTG motif) [Minicystis rosea]|nr:Putative cell-wall-anchored protein SasA (LPXTG motif) [Minicystis rosea]